MSNINATSSIVTKDDFIDSLEGSDLTKEQKEALIQQFSRISQSISLLPHCEHYQ